MLIKDEIYGVYNVNEPVLIELIKSRSFQRLKKISQFGLPDKFYHIKGYTRYDHSLGVMILLRKLGVNLEGQIIGLLHDISHTAFSHVIDWVLNSQQDENHQDRSHESYFVDSDISKILVKYGFNTTKISDHTKFQLLDRDIPDICADRLDYAFREFPLSIARKCLDGLIITEDYIVFKNKKLARLFAENFLERQIRHWGGYEGVARWYLFSYLLKEALSIKKITLDDFKKNDDYIIRKLVSGNNMMINNIFNILEKKDISYLPKSSEKIIKKFRYVDPLYLSNKKLVRLSSTDDYFKTNLKRASRENKKGILLPKI